MEALFSLSVMVLVAMTSISNSDTDACSLYTRGKLTENEISVYRSLEEIRVIPPPASKRLTYRNEYLAQPHLRGATGYPYEISMSFEMNIDTGQPVPQFNRAYTKTIKQNRDFRITIRSTWSEIEKHLPSRIALPIERTIAVEDYEVAAEQYGMSQVVYPDVHAEIGSNTYARRFHGKNDIFLTLENGKIQGFMVCDKDGAVVVPHCEKTYIQHSFLVEVRFKRILLGDLSSIRQHAVNFLDCILKEN
ncbi:hypothetical protein [Ascidiaceihabitans sp.]|uniref:hypothetical protein n=1 Tax=Ascidiaceihabitans sp. TaxID=1872644 RepID=UPI00329A500C